MVSKTSVDCDIIFKILLLGDSSVGKTCLLLRFTEDTYTENHISTIGVDYRIKMINTPENRIIKLQIWDTAGQDRFRSITKNYFRGSNGIMLIYDINSQITFINIKNWVMQIKDQLGEEACVILVGNKLDLQQNREVTTEQGKKFANDNSFGFFEASAKTNFNIVEAFEQMTKEMLKKESKNENKQTRKRGSSLIDADKKKKKCCG